MPKGVLTVMTICTEPAREEEYNRWYLHTHLPDLSKAQGFVRARRFRSVDLFPNSGKASERRFLALYEFDSPDLRASYKDLLRLALKAVKLGRHISFMAPSQAPGGGLWEEQEPSQFKPLTKHGYPQDTPYLREMTQRVRGIIDAP